jgi:hypothetical protein
MLQLVQQYSSSMRPTDVAAAYYCLGRMCQQDAVVAQAAGAQQVLQALDQLLPAVLQRLPARHLSNIIWG